MSVPTVSEVLAMAKLDVAEQDLTSTCEQCRVQRHLSECKTQEQGTIRSYRCRTCSRLLVEVGSPSNPFYAGSYRVAAWEIRPTTDLFAHIRGNRVRIGAKRHAAVPHDA